MPWHNNPLFDDEDPDEDAAIGFHPEDMFPLHEDDDHDNPPCPYCRERYDHEPWCTWAAMQTAAYYAEMEAEND